jgi:hypothetical protein
MHDPEPAGMIAVAPSEAPAWNERHHGIFAPIQEFDGARRIENLRRIRAWAVDLDKGTKAEQIARLTESPLKPSSVVETKNGHHAYWYALPGAKAGHYRAITSRLVEFFDGDKNARDLARVMRVPGFLHWKNPSDPFRVVRVCGPYPYRYSEREMCIAFPASTEEVEAREKARAEQTPTPSEAVFPSGSTFWGRAYDLDAREALPRLSGHWAVGGERIELKPQRSGKHNVWCDGKGTSCFVDANGKIGSSDGGGPGVAQWCFWHLKDYRKVKEALLEVFPELGGAS